MRSEEVGNAALERPNASCEPSFDNILARLIKIFQTLFV
jgi:hypothetical protein